MDALRRFYQEPVIRRRICEYLGGRRLEEATARFVVFPTPLVDQPFSPLPVEEVWNLLNSRLEAARSLWDQESLIAHLDLEHVHFDRPWQPLADPGRCFALQRPVADAIRAVLAEEGIAPLHLLTGRGHHFVWRIGFDSPAFGALARLGRPNAGLRRFYELPQPALGERVGAELGAARHGLGKVLEYVAHRVLARVEGRCEVPVQLTAVTVGPGPQGREVVSLDLSAAGDPLSRRSLRIPFTAYRKGVPLGAPPELAEKLLVVVPVADGDEEGSRSAMGDLARVSWLASRVSTAIPLAATEGLVEHYLGSSLAAFHTFFEAEEPEPPERWPETYDRLDLGELPLCARRILEQPNDLLLQPAGIQIVVRVLLAQGWHPRHIAGLLLSKYSRDHGWIPGLHFHEPGVRADFYTRLFAGLVDAGLDRLIDFNCVSTREKGYCPGEECGWNLLDLADRLRAGGLHG